MSQALKQSNESVPFIDLKAQQARVRSQIDDAIKRVLDHGRYIMGPEVQMLETALSEFCGAKHAITCSSGTDALSMILMAKGVKQGDAVFIPSFTFPATAEVVALLGATPVFVDVDEYTYNIDVNSLEAALVVADKKGLKPSGILAVDLFGQPADYDALEVVAKKHDLWILCDAAQSFGARLNGRNVGQFGMASATSFFPAKPLGCYGDGGCVFTDDDTLAHALKSIRVHGKGEHKYDNVRIGLNARLDTIQAAILIEKLKVFPDELAVREEAAQAYNEALKDRLQVPQLIKGAQSSWAQYTIRLPKGIDRAELMANLKKEGIPTMVYYEKPLHLQKAYAHCPTATGGSLPVSELLSKRVLSLPMSGYVTHEQVLRVVRKLKLFLA